MAAGTADRPGNRAMIAELHALLAHLLGDVLQRGWHGTTGVMLSIQDGVIHASIREVRERTIRPEKRPTAREFADLDKFIGRRSRG